MAFVGDAAPAVDVDAGEDRPHEEGDALEGEGEYDLVAAEALAVQHEDQGGKAMPKQARTMCQPRETAIWLRAGRRADATIEVTTAPESPGVVKCTDI